VADFFGPLPAGADVYLLRNILHDWPDEQAVAILSRCAQAARGDGRVLVAERVITTDGDQNELTGMDLRMLLLFGSRERTLAEFNALADAAGMRPVSTRATTSSYWLLEYAPNQPAEQNRGPRQQRARLCVGCRPVEADAVPPR